VAHAGAAVERVDDGVDDRGRRADGAGLAGAFDAERVGRRRYVVGGKDEGSQIEIQSNMSPVLI
jgi:hypothetical protein